jgi:hypothetical protein
VLDAKSEELGGSPKSIAGKKKSRQDLANQVERNNGDRAAKTGLALSRRAGRRAHEREKENSVAVDQKSERLTRWKNGEIEKKHADRRETSKIGRAGMRSHRAAQEK